jgi:hypothetical protein
MDGIRTTHGRNDKCIKILVGISERENNSGDLDIGGRILLKLILMKYWIRIWTGFI